MQAPNQTQPRRSPRRALASVMGAGLALALVVGCSDEDPASGGLLDGGAGGLSAGAGGADARAGTAGVAGAPGGNTTGGSAGSQSGDAGVDAADADAGSGPCPEDMVLIDPGAAPPAPQLLAPVCMDRYEAPNRLGELPLVMLNFDEAEAWCGRHHKRLCFDDEWTYSCAGPEGYKYPYGNTRRPGVCNDAKLWKSYNQSLLNGWPYTFDGSGYDTLEALLSGVSDVSSSAQAAAEHIRALYQAEVAGSYPGCLGVGEARDLTGSVEEWTRRRSGGEPQFHGNLKGRYWADTRTCQNNITTHGDGFRFYEIGFRCCSEPEL